MCAGDMTLEEMDTSYVHSPVFPKTGNTGYNNLHVCRNWAGLIETVRPYGVKKTRHGWVTWDAPFDSPSLGAPE